MSGIRTIEQQFEVSTANHIRLLMSRVNSLRKVVPGGATRYYLYEIYTALEAGALLAALHLASTSIELFLRAKIVESVASVRKRRTLSLKELTFQERLEEDKKLKVSDLLKYLVAAGLFRPEDERLANEFYRDIRTPLAHGLLKRFANGRPIVGEFDITRLFRDFTGQNDIERLVEHCSLEHIETVIGLLERNSKYRRADTSS